MTTLLPPTFADRTDHLSDEAFRLYVNAIVWSNRARMNGLIPRQRPRRLVPTFRQSALEELLASGLWSMTDDGYYQVDMTDILYEDETR